MGDLVTHLLVERNRMHVEDTAAEARLLAQRHRGKPYAATLEVRR